MGVTGRGPSTLDRTGGNSGEDRTGGIACQDTGEVGDAVEWSLSSSAADLFSLRPPSYLLRPPLRTSGGKNAPMGGSGHCHSRFVRSWFV